jgi:hypothetical protein
MASVSVDVWRDRPAAILAVFGAISGVLSATLGFMFEPPWLEPVARLFYLEAGMMPIGLFFGVALGLGLAFCTGRLWAFPLVLITTLIAWSAAIHTAQSIAGIGEAGTNHARNLVSGLAAGAIGAALTYAGSIPVSAALRRPAGIALATVVGGVCGLLFWLGELHVISDRLLYIVWQPAVAACIGLALAGMSSMLAPTATSALRRP